MFASEEIVMISNQGVPLSEVAKRRIETTSRSRRQNSTGRAQIGS